AFAGCMSLSNATIGSNVTNIGLGAFVSCLSLTGITIPKRVTKIGNNAFLECTSLMAIDVDTLNPVYSSADGVLLNKSQTTLIECPWGKAGSYAIPNTVTS